MNDINFFKMASISNSSFSYKDINFFKSKIFKQLWYQTKPSQTKPILKTRTFQNRTPQHTFQPNHTNTVTNTHHYHHHQQYYFYYYYYYQQPKQIKAKAEKDRAIMYRDTSCFNTYNYGDALYWDARYVQEGGSFDWYQRYSALRPFVRNYVSTSSRVLMVGCGNAGNFSSFPSCPFLLFLPFSLAVSSFLCYCLCVWLVGNLWGKKKK